MLRLAALLFGLAICAVPISIAVAESLLGGALLFRLVAIAGGRARLQVTRAFWFWLAWAALEGAVWLRSPEIRAGIGEMRHVLLMASLFVMMPALSRPGDRLLVWRGLAVTASIGSLFLACQFVWKLLSYRGALPAIVYLRSGGLLHHWMVYGVVEIIVFAGLLELRRLYPEDQRWLLGALGINALGILLSLTRMLWICALLLLGLHLAWRRSRWLWALPGVPCVLFFASPGVIRSRVLDSARPDYYSNAERVQMLRVGWRMIRENLITGVGPGRVNELYTNYLTASDPVPAFHGHLHNNAVQLAAEFGLPVTGAALLFVAVLFYELRESSRRAVDREQQFLCRTAVLGLAGFLAAGLFDYTYGHSLGLILLGFATLSPFNAPQSSEKPVR